MDRTVPISSSDLLGLAKTLLGLSQVHGVVGAPEFEEANRACISRAYYALYHQALVVANDLELPEASAAGGSHVQLAERYRSQGRRMKSIAAGLQRAKMQRVKADYLLSETVTRKDAELHLQQCSIQVEEIERIAQSARQANG